MIINRDVEQKIEKKLEAQNQLAWDKLANDVKFHAALFFTVDEAIAFQCVSRGTLSLMNKIWKARFEVHFAFDLPRLQRKQARLKQENKVDYLAEYKKCDIRDNTNYSGDGNRYTNHKPRSVQDTHLLKLFKEGNLEEIKGQNPPVKLLNIFNICDSQGRTLIQWARKNGHQAVLDYFYWEALKQYPLDADINYRTGVFDAPRIYWAACFNQIDALEKFLEIKEIDVNTRTKHFETALHIAAAMGNTTIVDKLLAAKAEVNVQDTAGRTPCYEGAWAGHDYIIHLLLNAKANIDLQLRHNEKSPLYGVEIPSQTLLMKTSERGNYEVASVLLKRVEVQVDRKKIDGKTALWTAVEFGQHEMLPLLIEAKADVNITDDRNQSLFSMALSKYDFRSMEILMEYKANVDIRSRDLIYFSAKEKEHPVIKKLEVVADINAELKSLSSIHPFWIFWHTWTLRQFKKSVTDKNTEQANLKWIKLKSLPLFWFTDITLFYNRAHSVVKPSTDKHVSSLNKMKNTKRN